MHFLSLFSSFYWDPPREAFTIPFTQHPIVWYGILFVSGFILGYFIINGPLTRMVTRLNFLSNLDIKDWPALIALLHSPSSSSEKQFSFITQLKTQLSPSTLAKLQNSETSPFQELQQQILDAFNQLLKANIISREELHNIFPNQISSLKETAYRLTDSLCWFTIIGTVLGARLGEVFFYHWPRFREHPAEIFMIWRGGLASHGGVIGVILALYLYTRYIRRAIPQFSFLSLLDCVAIPSSLVACFIRLGNFMNQEIVGTPTEMPWGIIFGHPADDVTSVPRHPIQLYEATAYFLTFLILWTTWKKQKPEAKPGILIGLMFILIFGSRVFLEFFKTTLHYK